jgi:hypothetical protein
MLSLLKKTIRNLKLNKKLRPLLNIFKEKLLIKLPLFYIYDYIINTREEAFINKPYFSLSFKKLKK